MVKKYILRLFFNVIVDGGKDYKKKLYLVLNNQICTDVKHFINNFN